MSRKIRVCPSFTAPEDVANRARRVARVATRAATCAMEHSREKERVPLLPVGGGLPEPADESASSSQVYKLPIFDIRVSVDAALRVGVCVALCMQNSAYTLSRRYGSGVLKETASSQSILAVGEIMKLLFSAAMIRRGPSCSQMARPDPSSAAMPRRRGPSCQQPRIFYWSWIKSV